MTRIKQVTKDAMVYELTSALHPAIKMLRSISNKEIRLELAEIMKKAIDSHEDL